MRDGSTCVTHKRAVHGATRSRPKRAVFPNPLSRSSGRRSYHSETLPRTPSSAACAVCGGGDRAQLRAWGSCRRVLRVLTLLTPRAVACGPPLPRRATVRHAQSARAPPVREDSDRGQGGELELLPGAIPGVTASPCQLGLTRRVVGTTLAARPPLPPVRIQSNDDTLLAGR